MRNLIRHIQQTAHRHSLWKKSDGIIIGVSGGPDSTCLFFVLQKLSQKYDFKLHVAHVNYNLRANDSRMDEIFVTDLCAKKNVPLSVLNVSVPLDSQSENNFRTIRYNYFETLRSKFRYQHIAVGHNLNDQAETLLLHLIRGSGLHGLGGMRYKNGNIIRPLLDIPREIILDYLNANTIPFRTDSTNDATEYTRNKIRNIILPILEQINPDIIQRLATTASLASSASDYIRTSASEALPFKDESDGVISFSAKRFLSLHDSIQGTLLTTFLNKHIPSDKIRFTVVEEVKKMVKSTKNKSSVISFGSLKFTKSGDTVKVTVAHPPEYVHSSFPNGCTQG